ncbi:MAG: hypothetical protein LBL66_02380 [Clostridiales bacterium]|nr:hypothetical protein [Clostridiales bacterium]
MTTEVYRKALRMACRTLMTREIGGRDCHKVLREYLNDKDTDQFGVLETDYYDYFLETAAKKGQKRGLGYGI